MITRALLVAFTALALLDARGSRQTLDPLAARSKGRRDAPVTLYEMSDFQCPYCRAFALGTMPLLEPEYLHTGKVRLGYINLPLTSVHSNAQAAAQVAVCAARQDRFWPMHDLLFRHQDDWAKLPKPEAFLLALGDSARLDHAALARCLAAKATASEVDADAARFDKKLARGLDARRGVTQRLAAWAKSERDPGRPLVWVHAASVGEGLQAKPVLEALRAEAPSWQLAYTFFSPSAERLARTLPADVADYLPLDRPVDVAAVLDALKPTALVFSKLDVWPELTLAAARRGVKLGLISATVAPHSSRLRWPTRGWAEPAYRALDRIGTISEDDGRRLEQLGARRSALEVTGDTRYDSVAERAERFDRTRDPFARLAIAP